MSLCQCGCGQEVVQHNKYRVARFIHGHNCPWLGKHRSDSTKEKLSFAHSGKTISIITRNKLSRKLKGRIRPRAESERSSLSLKRVWSNPVKKEKWLKSIFKACSFHPNKPETVLNNLLQKLYPNEWKFVGDGSTFIGGKSPDFINVNGQKKIIEMYGDYFHNDEKVSNGEDRINHFKKFGFDTLIVWENELQRIDRVVLKIQKFVEEY